MPANIVLDILDESLGKSNKEKEEKISASIFQKKVPNNKIIYGQIAEFFYARGKNLESTIVSQPSKCLKFKPFRQGCFVISN